MNDVDITSTPLLDWQTAYLNAEDVVQKFNSDKQAAVGLALSGGAAYGMSNAGVLNVLERNGIQPNVISGSSMGAIVGALYAYTGSNAVFENMHKRIDMFRMAHLRGRILSQGLHGGVFTQRLHDILGDVFNDAVIGDCKLPFLCAAAKVKEPISWNRITEHGFMEHMLQRIEPHVFGTRTRIMDALMASSAIPVLFAPVKIEDDEYIDLIHFGAIPVAPLVHAAKPTVTIATDTNPRYAELAKWLPVGWARFLNEGHKELDYAKSLASVVIEPKAAAAIYRFDRIADFIAAGEEATDAKMDEIRALLKNVEYQNTGISE